MYLSDTVVRDIDVLKHSSDVQDAELDLTIFVVCTFWANQSGNKLQLLAFWFFSTISSQGPPSIDLRALLLSLPMKVIVESAHLLEETYLSRRAYRNHDKTRRCVCFLLQNLLMVCAPSGLSLRVIFQICKFLNLFVAISCVSRGTGEPY